MNYNKLLEIAINASLAGGLEIMKVYSSNFEVEHKKDKSPLTLADKNCHNTIEDYLSATNIPLLSEEGSNFDYADRKNWEYFWMVDPLDGTKEFVKRNGEFTVNIALIHNESPIMGVIYVPVKKDLYFSLNGLGAFKFSNASEKSYSLNDLISSSLSLPILTERECFTIVGSRSHMSAETEKFFNKKKEEYGDINILSVGSSLKLCMVAEGKADVYPRYAPTMEWDTAAGDAICRSSGFQVLQYKSEEPLRYNKEDLLNPWFLVK